MKIVFHVLHFPNCLLPVIDLSDFASCNILCGEVYWQNTPARYSSFMQLQYMLSGEYAKFGCVDPPPGDNENLQWGREAVTLYCSLFLCPFLGSSVVDHNTNSSKNSQRILLGDFAVASL